MYYEKMRNRINYIFISILILGIYLVSFLFIKMISAVIRILNIYPDEESVGEFLLFLPTIFVYTLELPSHMILSRFLLDYSESMLVMVNLIFLLLLGLLLQRHFCASTKLAYVKSRVCGRKRQGKEVFYTPINLCAKKPVHISVAVGLFALCTCSPDCLHAASIRGVYDDIAVILYG